MLSGQGGWPMSVFLTPDLRPFYGGTYYPPDDRYGRPGFKRILLSLIDAWRNNRPRIGEVSAEVTANLGHERLLRPAEGALDASLIRNAVVESSHRFDPRHGGFGDAPKFPHPMDLRLLLRAWKRFDDDSALHMARLTLDRMAMGGIYDHLGGGFARYSTDERWLAPHFEKMLYDNALLTSAYVEAYQATREPAYREVVEETLAWVRREMTSPEGPFYSTLDADSEGKEGKFYVWSQREVEEVLGKELADTFTYVYGVQPLGNWQDPHDPNDPDGKNILHRTKTDEQEARMLGLSVEELRRRLDASKGKLFEVRSKRVWPGRDEKTLTSWNGLMIGAFALAAQALDNTGYAEAASRAADFIVTRMRTPDGRLLRTWSAGSEPKLNAYLEDYSFLIDGLVSLYEATFEPRWIESALDLARVMVEQFWDDAQGGFFYTGRDHERLIARNKDPLDNAVPSGNSMAATGLLRLAKLTGRADLFAKAEATLQLYRGLLAEHPMAAGQALAALDFYLGPVQEFAVAGDPDAEDTRRVLRAVRGGFRPNKVVALKPPAAPPGLDEVIPLLGGKTAAGTVTTYVCENFACQAPLVGAEAAEAALAQGRQ
jgi:uncharacterized protein YyaL (SSP411 family)